MPSETTLPMRLTGQYFRVVSFHAVPPGALWATAICGIKPERQGKGWAAYVCDAVTCSRCLKKLARAATMIVTSHPPRKRRSKSAQPVEIATTRVVEHIRNG